MFPHVFASPSAAGVAVSGGGAGWKRWRPAVGLLAALVLAMGGLRAAAEGATLTFVGVALGAETARADEKLRDYLRAKDGFAFESRDLEYAAAIETLVNWDPADQGPLVARVTPYVCVVAEMLGANLDILGTFVSRLTQETTYQSYFVLHRSAAVRGDDLEALVKFLRSRATPLRFVYQSKFSSSGYFLPTLHFRRLGVFSANLPNSAEQRNVFIRAEHQPGTDGGAELVRLVKLRRADLVAIGGSLHGKVAEDPDLRFIKIPNTLPNDLLVMISMPDRRLRERIVAALRQMQEAEINTGDVQRWQDFALTPEARRALAALRRMTKAPPAPVPIKIRDKDADGTDVPLEFQEAARQAVQISGTEFTVFNEDFHKHFDVVWTLRKSHDDSLVLVSEYPDFKLPPQQFHISYRRGDRENLVARIEEQISNGMHRVRDLWMYEDETPTVLRDVRFGLRVGTVTRAVKLTWNDLTNNDRAVGSPFDVEVAASDFHAFKLKVDGFPKRSDGIHLDFDPLSNTGYRVILERPRADTGLFRLGTYLLIGLLSAAAILALRSILQGGPRPGPAGSFRPGRGGAGRPAPAESGSES